MQGEQTEFVWGVIDFIPDTDFPDFRTKSAVHSNNGTCMVIPREGDNVRLYIQLDSKDAADTSTVRVDKSQMNPYQLLDVCAFFFRSLQWYVLTQLFLKQVARKSLHPYTIQTPDAFDWWTVYNSMLDQSSSRLWFITKSDQLDKE